MEPNEQDLVARWRAGDASANASLFELHFRAVYRFFSNKTGGQIDDLVQETFASCLENPERFEGRASFRSYLLGIARNRLLMHYRKQARGQPEALCAEALGVFPVDATEQSQERRVLLRSLRKLPLESQILLELGYWEDVTEREIAAMYGVPLGTIKSRIRKARLLLRDKIAETLADSQFQSTVDTIDAWFDSMRARAPRD